MMKEEKTTLVLIWIVAALAVLNLLITVLK